MTTTARSSVYLEVVEAISKKRFISEGNTEELAKEILIQASHLLNINRVNAWLMDYEGQKLECLLAYDRTKNDFYKENDLLRSQLPNWFYHFSKNDLIISADAQREAFNTELLESYLKPHNVMSMMEVPIQSAGHLLGIICFEHQGSIRIWNSDEQHFAMALAQLLTLAVEIREKNSYRKQLEHLLNEKNLLIKEINHRVKNNLSIITAFIRGELNQSKDEYHRDLFRNVLSKTYSLASLQELMYQTQNYEEVNLNEFLKVIVNNLKDSYPHNYHVKVNFYPNGELLIDVNKAISIGLICNELITNAFKYAFVEGRDNVLNVHFEKFDNGKFEIQISDNGQGFDTKNVGQGTGIDLVYSLTEQIDGNITISSGKDGTNVKLVA